MGRCSPLVNREGVRSFWMQNEAQWGVAPTE